MRRPASEWFRVSERWMRNAELARRQGRRVMARACMRQHIIWRADARRLAKQEKKP